MKRTRDTVTMAVLSLALAGTVALAAATPEELAKTAIASVKRQPAWGEIQITEAAPTKYVLLLLYKATPAGMAAVERDTMTIARALLQTLVADGHKPTAEKIYIRVTARQPVKGETGADMVRPFGSTRYTYENDSLSFKDEAIRR